MKRIILMFLAVLVAISFACTGVAEAKGLLGSNYVGIRGGMIDLGEFSETGSFGELRVQVALEGNTPVDLTLSHLVGGTDNIDIWLTRVGANIQIKEQDRLRIYGGGNYSFFEWEHWSGASDDDTFFGVHLGFEKDLSPTAALDIRFTMEDIADEMDPQVYVEVINWFDDQFAALAGANIWLDSEVNLYYVGLAIHF